MRPSAISYHLAKHLLYTSFRDPGEEPPLHLFGQINASSRQWLDDGYLVARACRSPRSPICEMADQAAERIYLACQRRRPGRAAHQGDPRRLQPHRLLPLRQLHHHEAALHDRRRAVPRQLRGAATATGRRSWRGCRAQPACAGLREEPGHAVSRCRIATAPCRGATCRTSSCAWMTAARPPQPDPGDQGLSRRRRAAQGRDDAHALGAGRQQSRLAWPLGLRRVHRAVHHSGRLRQARGRRARKSREGRRMMSKGRVLSNDDDTPTVRGERPRPPGLACGC